MKAKVFIMLCMLILSTQLFAQTNLIDNGEFSQGTTSWGFWTDTDASADYSVGNNEMSIAIQNGGSNIWSVLFYQEDITLEYGEEYVCTFYARAASARTISAIAAMSASPWTVYSNSDSFSLTTETQRYSFSFVMNSTTDTTAQIEFDLGQNAADVYIDTVALYKAGTVNAYEKIEAENYSAQSGTDVAKCLDGTEYVGWTENTDWLKYRIDFGTVPASRFVARVSSHTAGGNIEIRLDSVTGTKIGDFGVGWTGGWDTWVTGTSVISNVTGVHDVYLVFTGGAGYMINLNHFRFVNDTTPPSAPGNIVITNYSTSSILFVWGAATDNDTVARYEIRYEIAGGVYQTKYSQTTGASLDDLQPGTTYTIKVRALDAQENYGPWVTTQLTTDVSPTYADWDASTYYSPGQKVTHRYKQWTARVPHANVEPGTGTAWIEGADLIQDAVVFVVDLPTYASMANEILQYKADVEFLFNQQIHIETGSWTTITGVRSLLQTLYNEHSIDGAILIGDIPMCHWEFPPDQFNQQESCALTFYYEELDGDFYDDDNDGKIDRHVWGANDGPEIWISVMEPQQDIENIRGLLNKSHNYYRGLTVIEDYALFGAHSDYGGSVIYANETIGWSYGSNVDVVGGEGVQTNAVDFYNLLSTKAYEFTNIAVHSGAGTGLHFNNGQVTPYQLKNCNGTGALISNISGCHSGDYLNAPSNCIGSSIIYGTNIGQASIATARSLWTWQSGIMMNALANGAVLADAYKEWQDTINTYSYIVDPIIGGPAVVEVYMWTNTLFGNPFLKITD